MVETVRAFMLAWCLAHHYAPFQAEALIHQARIESGGQYWIISPNGSCLFQWVGVRRRGLMVNGKCPDLETQMAYADRELHTYFSCFFAAPPDKAYNVFRATFARGPTC